MDAASRRGVIEALAALKGQAAVIVATHDEELAAIADKVYYLAGTADTGRKAPHQTEE